MADTLVRMEHPDFGSMNVTPAKVGEYLANGWQLAEGQTMPDIAALEILESEPQPEPKPAAKKPKPRAKAKSK